MEKNVSTLFLTKGKRTIIDTKSYSFISDYSWHVTNQGYARTSTYDKGIKKSLYLHRFLLGNPKGIVDHINGDPLDNRLENLQICTQSVNVRKARKNCKSVSTFKGVTKDNRKQRSNAPWVARIWDGERNKHLGYFKDEKEAHLTYMKAREFYLTPEGKVYDGRRKS